MILFDYLFYNASGNMIYSVEEENISNAVIKMLHDCNILPVDDYDKNIPKQVYFAEKRSDDLLLQTYQLGELKSLDFF